MPSLSIVIPTYNRAAKLLRLLKNIEVELNDFTLRTQVQVLVSDNASSDDTEDKVASFKSEIFKVDYFRQEKNIGFDGNVRFLYESATTDYVWFFSDDDILLPGSIATVMAGLKETTPEVLLFSFIQPPSSKMRTFNQSNPCAVITELTEVIRFVAQYPKVSIYVCRKVEFSENQKEELEPFYENGYYWIDLCYSILAAVSKPRLCIISQPLACCDEEFNNIRFEASVCLERYGIFYHPFVLAYLPNLVNESRRQSYYDVIQLMFAVKMGTITSETPLLFEKEIKVLQFRALPLLMSSRSLVQFMLLKFGLVALYRAYKKL